MKTAVYMVILFICGVLFLPRNKVKAEPETKAEVAFIQTSKIVVEDTYIQILEQDVLEQNIYIENRIGDIKKNQTYIQYKKRVALIVKPFLEKYINNHVVISQKEKIIYEGVLRHFIKTRYYANGGEYTFDIFTWPDKVFIKQETIKL